MTDNNRPKGFLTYNPEGERVSDREYLVGDYDAENKDENWKSSRRGRIRERSKGALFDFSHLLHELDPGDRELIFTGDSDQPHRRGGNPLSPNQDLSDVEGDFKWDFLGGWKGPDFRPAKGDEELIHAVADTIAFLWIGCCHAHVDPKQVMATGIERGMEELGRSRRVADVSIVPDTHLNRRKAMAKRGREKMMNGEDLDSAEAHALITHSGVPHSIVVEYLRGDIDTYELSPLSFEREDKDR